MWLLINLMKQIIQIQQKKNQMSFNNFLCKIFSKGKFRFIVIEEFEINCPILFLALLAINYFRITIN